MKTILGRKVYSVLLRSYPKKFRQEYGLEMVRLLRDCERDAPNCFALGGLWIRTVADLIRTVPSEHLQNLRKENDFMSKLRAELIAIGGAMLLIVVAFALLTYGRSHQVPAILVFGYVLDAIVFTGIVGNTIVFLLTSLTPLSPLKTAFWTFLFVCGITVLALTAVAGRVDPNFQTANVLIGYVGSFVFWYGFHWLSAQTLRPTVST